MPGFRIGDLPRDMREELFNLHATSVDPRATEHAFYRRVVPTREIDISRIDVSGYSPASTASYDLSKTPPIVIADGKLIDGGHRVAAAQRKGLTKLCAIDLTGLLDPAKTGSVANLRGMMMRRRRRSLGASNPRGCNIGSIEQKIADVRRDYKPAKRFKSLFDHVLNLARDSAKHGYCQRAGQEIRHAKKVAGYR